MKKFFHRMLSMILCLLMCASLLIIPTLATDVEGISLNENSTTIYIGGEWLLLEATVLPEDASDKTVTWTSSNEEVATVQYFQMTGTHESVAICPIKPGETTITAQAGAYSATCKVTVDEFDINELGLTVGNIFLENQNRPYFTGQEVDFRVGYSLTKSAPSGTTLHVDIFDGAGTNGTLLFSSERTQFLAAGSYGNEYNSAESMPVRIESLPENLLQLTFGARLEKDGVYSDYATKTIEVSTLGFRQSGTTHLSYLDVPGAGMGYYSTNDNGPIVYDMAAFVDPVTGVCSTYFATNGGVVKQNADGSYQQITGINGTPVAIGGEDENTLCVLTASYAGGSSTGGNTQYLIWQFDQVQNSWNALSSNAFTMQHSYLYEFGNLSFDPVSCVINSNSIWIKNTHWNGSEWLRNEVIFNSFWKDDKGAFAGSEDGIYRYESGAWTKVLNSSDTVYIVAGMRSGQSVTLLTANTYEPEHRATDGSLNLGIRGGQKIEIAADGTVAIGDMDTTTFMSGNKSSLIGMGINGNGDVFGFLPGRSYNGNDFGGYGGSLVYRFTGGEWIYQIIPEFNDTEDQANIDAGNYPDDRNGIRKSRPDGVRYTLTPVEGMTFFLGLNGAIYADYGMTTINFDSNGGSAVTPITKQISTAVPTPASPTLEGKTFGGWFYDEAFTMEWDAYDALMPAKDITLYAKWIDGDDPEAQLAWYKQKAVTALEKQFDKYSPADYSEENWNSLLSAYEFGKASINAASVGTAHIEDNVTAALNAALAAMQAVPAKNSREITIAISMDANTLGLGYIIEPTLVTVNKGTPVSVVIADLLSQRAEEKYGITTAGRTDKPSSIESFSTLYPWSSSGTPTQGFYLAQVYFPEQENYHIPDAIWSHIDPQYFIADDANGKYLGEFDYLNTSGWTYSVGDKTEGNAEFPGVGSSAWSLSDGEVVRWQFTLLGYGADLGADNTAWGTSNVVTVGDKSCLTWKVAELRSQYSDEVLKAESVYTNALAVLTDAEASQAAIDAALQALNGMSASVPQAVPEEKIEITAKASGERIAAVTTDISNDGTATLHVTAANPCVVIVKKADGIYERLEAVKNGDSYDFSQADYTEAMEFHVLLKGDFDGNGTVSTDDAMQLARACLSPTHLAYLEASELIQAAYGTVTTDLAMQIARSCLSPEHAAFKALTW